MVVDVVVVVDVDVDVVAVIVDRMGHGSLSGLFWGVGDSRYFIPYL